MKKIISSDRAPAAIGPYSQAVKVDCQSMLYVSGQIALDPDTMEIVGASAAEQCRQVMKNLGEVLGAAGAGFADIVKTTLFLENMDDFADVNEVYATYFESAPPARATVQVGRLPMNVKVEIEAVAAL
ncbi:MAG: RidA family protein [candidate division Zixibacteria bacterium]|nr:RidA family protein [candidate division Zixibacteria bacterium]